jgi:hypothetical protein
MRLVVAVAATVEMGVQVGAAVRVVPVLVPATRIPIREIVTVRFTPRVGGEVEVLEAMVGMPGRLARRMVVPSSTTPPDP